MELLNIYEKIYKDVFCKTFSRFFFVFLCGGADKNNIRNRVRTYLEKERFQVLYPEDLFMDMLNRDKNSDLLEYENLLADMRMLCASFVKVWGRQSSWEPLFRVKNSNKN